jgi:hypothetical protein
VGKITQVDIGESFFGGDHFLRDLPGLGQLVSIFVSNAIIVAGIILLFLLVFGGFSMIAGAGNKNPQQVAQGKQATTAAAVGFVIIIVAYWIVQLIGRATGQNLLQ